MIYDSTNEEAALARGVSRGQLEVMQNALGLTNADISKLSEKALLKAIRKLEAPDRPRQRVAYQRLQLVNDRGEIPPNAQQNALRQLDSMRLRARAPQVAGVPSGPAIDAKSLAPPFLPLGAGIAPGAANWVSIGPGNVGGRTRSIVIHPARPDSIWIGSVGGGVWFSSNGGASWAPVDDFMANLAVCCMVMEPTNPDIIYAGTGEGFPNVDAIRGAGIFRTQDGIHWSQIGSTVTPDFYYINRLACASDGSVMLAATNTGIWRSADRDRSGWTRTLVAEIADVKFSPTESRRAVAGGLRNGIGYWSDDGGVNWHQAAANGVWSGRVELAYSVKNPSIVYASVQGQSGEIWRSTDGGKTYKQMQGLSVEGSIAKFLGKQGWYDNVIWAGDPTNSDHVIVGGIDLWRSTDGGNTLRRVSKWDEAASAHADHHAIVSHPHFDGATNKTVFFGNDGGIYKTADVTTVGSDEERLLGWVKLVNNYGVTQFYGGAGNSTTGTIVGGSQDNGTVSYLPGQGASKWANIFGGDGGFVASDPSDGRYFYGEYVKLTLFRNSNGAANDDDWLNNQICGVFWNTAIGYWDWKPLPFTIPDAKSENALFISPFIMDPNNPECILAGGLSLWRTNDPRTPNTNSTGPSWTSIKGGTGQFISAIAVAQGNPDLIWVGYLGGALYKTANGTNSSPSWQLVDDDGSVAKLPNRFCTRIVIDPSDHQVVYVMFGGYENTNLWKTTDGGSTWTGLGNALPAAPVRTLAIHPRQRDFLYLGTEVGVFTSEDGGASWSPTNEGPTNCPVYELFWMNETLVCATHGRGMFQIDLSGV
ncbi:MAG: hypothetical protein HY913_13140 [Desulfomonile tiedjei]|nr:hypothetical protein [Desulfomonile tiedjei]